MKVKQIRVLTVPNYMSQNEPLAGNEYFPTENHYLPGVRIELDWSDYQNQSEWTKELWAMNSNVIAQAVIEAVMELSSKEINFQYVSFHDYHNSGESYHVSGGFTVRKADGPVAAECAWNALETVIARWQKRVET